MSFGFDMSELEKFDKELLDIANMKMPKESKKFIGKEGTKLKGRTKTKAKRLVQSSNKDFGAKNKSKKYHQSIKRGKVYKYKVNGAISTRVYSSAPHAHLIEHGHRQVTKDGKEVGFVQGKHVFESSAKEYEGKFYENAQKFIDDVLDKGLS